MPVRRRTLVAVVLVALTVILAGSWFGFSGRQGLTPVEPSGPAAEGIDELYLFIGFFAALIFLSVMIPLALILSRYRERDLPRDAEGPQIRGNTRLELLWTGASIAVVALLVGFTLYEAPNVEDPGRTGERANALEIQVEGRQFYWRYIYPNGAVAIDSLRLPVDRVARLNITAPEWDVVHSYWIPALGGKRDAIPGEVNELELLPERTGVFDGKCGELCGIQHTAMNFQAEVLTAQAFDAWVEQAAEDEELGRTMWEDVCSKCHFAAPEYAPNIAGNPLLGDADAITQIVTQGRGRMPAVGRGWTERELEALTEYLATLAPQESQENGDGG